MQWITLTSVLRSSARRCWGSDSISIRAIRPDDRKRIVKAFHDLDRQSIYQRFFFAKRELQDFELRQITECDGIRSVALVATIGSGNDEVVVGLGQYFKRGAVAEVAFAVAADYRGRRIATRLLRRLECIARNSGVSLFEADVLSDNRPMLKVFRHSGLPMDENEADGVVRVTLHLADARN